MRAVAFLFRAAFGFLVLSYRDRDDHMRIIKAFPRIRLESTSLSTETCHPSIPLSRETCRVQHYLVLPDMYSP